ncbi:MAG: DnaB-like helicase N-terminal domain-containing protein [Rhodospirillales bacterium]
MPAAAQWEAEMALLGAILVDNRSFERVSNLRPEHFVLSEHARVFDACGRLIERGQIADPVTLKGWFDQDEALTQVGGPGYLIKLADCAVTLINAGDYGRLLHDLYQRRELIALGEDGQPRLRLGDRRGCVPADRDGGAGSLRFRDQGQLRGRLRIVHRHDDQRPAYRRGGAQAPGPAGRGC